MRLVILTALTLGLGALLLTGFLRLARELLLKEFFPTPSMPGESADQIDPEIERETSSHSPNPTA
jgi:hypothetical protein